MSNVWSGLITADSFDGITNGLASALPVVIPAALGIFAVPFVWSMVIKMIKSGKRG